MFAELTHHVFVNGDIIFSRILKLLEFCETGGIAYEVAEVECHCFTGATGNDFSIRLSSVSNLISALSPDVNSGQ